MHSDCIFCKIAAGEAPADFVHQDDTLVVFKDIRPHAPVHLLVVPRKHIRSVNDLTAEDGAIVSRMIATARDMAKAQGVAESGYNLVFNVEKGGGQVIFHLHLHLLAGWKR
ncbi:MAG: histidine triad nucleotide-binding protein [Thermodesulfobacteriota bacterium]